MPTSTSNMNLSIPLAGESTYPTSVSDSLTGVDGHDHTSGKGVQIPTGGIVDAAITTAKLADTAITGAKLNSAIVDDSTIQIAANVLRVKDAGITKPKLAALGQQYGDCASYTVTSSTPTDVTGLTATITVTGRPVMIALIPIQADSGGNLAGSGAGYVVGGLDIVRGATTLFSVSVPPPSELTNLNPCFTFIDLTATAGSYTYKVQGAVFGSSSPAIFVTKVRLVVFEL